ncbi:MAG: T9SS type A sorting domain-containing protein [Muribaculaceae bacterium]|nr:T9SS type A sorting domain-containing protein [Muribaculaceae bacterium]MDE7394387.1 T9SS type A sorting domain-containing protein [Muribaculaceae bacterium]
MRVSVKLILIFVAVFQTVGANVVSDSLIMELIKNWFGETCTQPFGFSCSTSLATISDTNSEYNFFEVYDNLDRNVRITSTHPLKGAAIYSISGICAIHADLSGSSHEVSVAGLLPGIYFIHVYGETGEYNSKVVIR